MTQRGTASDQRDSWPFSREDVLDVVRWTPKQRKWGLKLELHFGIWYFLWWSHACEVSRQSRGVIPRFCTNVYGWERAWSGYRERRANRAAECLRIKAHLLNAGIERGLNKYSCSMLERIRELLVVIKWWITKSERNFIRAVLDINRVVSCI